MSGIFITGTDTGCGKTAVACTLARAAVREGMRVRVVKPIETGCPIEGGRPRPSDAGALALAADDRSPPDLVCPYALRLPAAPSVAAEAEGVDLDVDRIVKVVRSAGKESDAVIVEGAGGLLVPIRDGIDMAGLAARLELPVLVVARATLGTINHTQLTLQVAAQRGLRVLGVIVSHTEPDLLAPERANLSLLFRQLGRLLLAELPHGSGEFVAPVDVRRLLSQPATC